MGGNDAHDNAERAPLSKDAYPETTATLQCIGCIELFQVAARLAAVLLHNLRGDKLGIARRQSWQLGADELSLSAEKGWIVHFKMEVRNHLLKGDFQYLIQCLCVHGVPFRVWMNISSLRW